MPMVDGRTCPTTVTFGFLTNQMDGFRIATVLGPISPTMAGLGLATSLGDGRRITTVVGSPMAVHGPGGLARSTRATTRSGLLRTSRSGDGEAALASDLVLADGAASAGSRSDRATTTIRGGADTAGGSAS